jgi:murein DD-endopeptidase MepM/ murein hydrolase activator NlpD
VARSSNPLQRGDITVQAADTGDRLRAPTTNQALQLAQSLTDLQPSVRDAVEVYSAKEREKQTALARKAAIEASGMKLADAVREGKIAPTQNPWFMQAYAREGAAIRAQDAFAKLQLDSTSWSTRNDPAAFEKQWREGVANISQEFTGKDEAEGLLPVQAQATQQALASNVASNAQRIVQERVVNLTALSSHALQQAAAANGGTLTAEQAQAALAPAKQQWDVTGGDAGTWAKMVTGAITTTAYALKDPHMIDLMKAFGEDGSLAVDPSATFGERAEAPTSPTFTGNRDWAAATTGPALRAPTGQLPAQGRITSAFGAREAPVKGASTLHNGIDIAVPVGTPVVAPASGTVTEVGNNAKSGNFIRVDHGGGVVSSYAHLSAANVQVGQTIEAGAMLAKSGATGTVSGPNLHWVVRKDGKAVDPATFNFHGLPPIARPGAASPTGNELSPDILGDNPPPSDPAAQQAIPQVPLAQPPIVSKAPSLYDTAGVADAAESDRYRITQAVDNEASDRLRNIHAQVALRGNQGYTDLMNAHGADIMLGNLQPAQMLAELAKAHYSPVEAAEAIKQVHEAVSSTLSVANARLTARTLDPREAKATMDLHLEGLKNGYSADYEARVGAEVLAGRITGEDGERMVAQSVSTTRTKDAEARAEKAQQRAEANLSGREGITVQTYAQLKQAGSGAAALLATSLGKATGRPIDPKITATWATQINQIQLSYITAHPGDFEGARQAGRQAAADLLRQQIARRKRAQQAKPAANPRG